MNNEKWSYKKSILKWIIPTILLIITILYIPRVQFLFEIYNESSSTYHFGADFAQALCMIMAYGALIFVIFIGSISLALFIVAIIYEIQNKKETKKLEGEVKTDGEN